MPRPGTKVTERNCQPLSTVGRTGTRSSFCFLRCFLRHPLASFPTVGMEWRSKPRFRQNPYPPPRHDGSTIARNPVRPAHRSVFPMARDGFCSDFRTDYRIRFKMAFCCCILWMFLYIEGYEDRIQSKLRP